RVAAGLGVREAVPVPVAALGRAALLRDAVAVRVLLAARRRLAPAQPAQRRGHRAALVAVEVADKERGPLVARRPREDAAVLVVAVDLAGVPVVSARAVGARRRRIVLALEAVAVEVAVDAAALGVAIAGPVLRRVLAVLGRARVDAGVVIVAVPLPRHRVVGG